MGKAYFEIGIRDLTDSEQRDINLDKSFQSLRRAIRLNPGYYQGHFHLAQTISYLNYFSHTGIDYYDEYKKAARLTTFDTQAYFEVGRFLLTRWLELSEEDRRFTVDLLKNIRMTNENLRHILQIWALNVNDYSFIDEILPEESNALRVYAQFLGERRLSLEERHKKLAKAESLEYEKAKAEFMAGERNSQSQKLNQALSNFRKSLRILESIKFYQNLSNQNLIDVSEFRNTKKALYLKLTESLIQKTGNLREAAVYLKPYLEMEEDATGLADLELFLRSRNLLHAELSTFYNDFMSFYSKIVIDYKLNRFREVIDEGKRFKDNFISPPEALKKDMSRICQCIGGSYQTVDFLYDAEEFFQLALELDPNNLEALKGLRLNYQRLNKPEEVDRTNKRIDDLLTPQRMSFENLPIVKDGDFEQTLFLKEKKIGLVLSFSGVHPDRLPLLAICFNDQIVWENYLRGQSLSLSVNSREGVNVLQLQPQLQPVFLQSIESSADVYIVEDEWQSDTPAEPENPEPDRESFNREEEGPQENSRSGSLEKKQVPMLAIDKIDYFTRQDSLVIEIWSDPFSSMNTFELSNPNRVVVDLSGIRDIRCSRQFQIGNLGISQLRLGMFKPDTARIVVTTEENIPSYEVQKTQTGIRITFQKK